MGETTFRSWGHYPDADHEIAKIECRSDYNSFDIFPNDTRFLPYGNGRSYGDVCLNDGGLLIPTHELCRILRFDKRLGILRCEAGVLLGDIQKLALKCGWMLAVTPGTQFVTVGGAIANDVHGKNHHTAGTFGCHVDRFELLRSDGSRRICSSRENSPWYCATIGGLGLTGLITWAEIRLRPVSGPWIDKESIRFHSIDDFFSLTEESDREFEHTVSWIDCLAKDGQLGRGVFFRGNHSPVPGNSRPEPRRLALSMAFWPPVSLINNVSVKTFNFLYYLSHRRNLSGTVHYEPFFYPLDRVENWNRIYGRTGFLQHQFVLPLEDGKERIREILHSIGKARTGSFLAVLKMFGKRKSPGMLSFPRPGITLALDFPIRGKDTFRLFNRLDAIVRSSGGAIYPAKDARMAPETFKTGYPTWQEFSTYIDPKFSSSFWRRVTK